MASRKLNMADLNSEEGEQRNLARVLRLKDLILLGVGSTLGMGGYVLAGDVAKKNSGPGVIVSFLMAAIASSFSCLSYGEFAARVPKAGSAYTYTYICVNELVAFLIGWNLVLEYVIGIATVAKGLSNYIDALLGYRMRTAIMAKFSLNVNFMASYPDLLSFFIVIALTFLLTQKVRKSTSVNNIFTIVNLLTVFIVIISGLFKANSYNWNIPKNDIPKGVNGGQGGFFPFGFAGVAAGAAKCFYGFIGFDAIATTGEEAIRPKRDIPIAMIVSLFIVTIAYCGIGTVLTLMWPYYDQDSDAPFPYVYDQLDWQIIKWIVSLGVIFALLTSLIGTMYPLPRILYAMSSDGLLFEIFSKVDSKNKTPVKATWISGVFAGVISTLFDLSQLIDMMSIGTLLAYSIVISCVVILRFKSDPANDLDFKRDVEPTGFMNKILYRAGKYFNTSNVKFANKETECLSTWIVIFYFAVSLLFCMIITHQDRVNYTYNEMTMYTTIVMGVGLLLLGIMLARQPQSNEKLSYMVPFVPVIPCLGILVNIYLMTKLDMHTWIRFSIWLGAGLLVYMTYGRQHSVVGLKLKQIKAEQKQIACAENVVVTRL